LYSNSYVPGTESVLTTAITFSHHHSHFAHPDTKDNDHTPLQLTDGPQEVERAGTVGHKGISTD